ncbi:uncharacterized protein LOC134818405 [Bolinopsis microptera]|uniref:uncharacterized protein LOC134818405 n=1 Tax=Bolinopsis microptera TaxID=2820187 RepID=UPI0030798BCA
MVVVVVGEPDNDAEHDLYTLVTGICVIFLGVVGLFLNSNTLAFFLKYNHRGEAHRKRFKTVLVNMSVVDILLSLAAATIRGPGFIWPSVIYGEATSSDVGTVRCKVLSIISSWLLSDLNMLAIIPISCICVFLPTNRVLRVIIAICWVLPIIEAILLIVGIEEHYLDSRYTDTYRKCSIHNAAETSFNWEGLVDYFNMVIFSILPLFIHSGIWISLCCKEPRMSRGKRLSGALVVTTALVTWLPYGIIYGILRYTPSGPKALVYIFFYLSIVTNPIIYGFLMYKCDIFREGCSDCCCGEDSDAQPSYSEPARVVEPKSFTDIVSGTTTMTDSVTRDGGLPQFQDRVAIVGNSSST